MAQGMGSHSDSHPVLETTTSRIWNKYLSFQERDGHTLPDDIHTVPMHTQAGLDGRTACSWTNQPRCFNEVAFDLHEVGGRISYRECVSMPKGRIFQLMISRLPSTSVRSMVFCRNLPFSASLRIWKLHRVCTSAAELPPACSFPLCPRLLTPQGAM